MNSDDILKKLSQAQYEFEQAAEGTEKTLQQINQIRKKQAKTIKELRRLLEATYVQSYKNARKGQEK